MGYTTSFAINSTSFAEATGWALKGFNPKREKDYILYELNAETSVLSVSSISNAYYFKKEVAVDDFQQTETDEDGSREKKDKVIKFAADGRFLQKMISILPKGVELKISEKVKDEHTSLIVKAPKQRLEVPLFDGKRPPKSPGITKLGDVSARDLTNALKALSKIADVSGAAAIPAVSGLDTIIHKDDGKLSFMATDMYALSEITLDFSDISDNEEKLKELTPENSANPRFLLNAQDAATLSKESGNPDSVIELGLDETGKIAFLFEDGRIACVSRIESEVINYGDFKSAKRDESSVIVETKEILNAIKYCNTMSWDNDDIIINIGSDGFSVTNRDKNTTHKVEYDEESDNSEIEEDIVVRFSFSVISKAFNPVSTDKVEIIWASAGEFFRMKPVLDSGNTQDNVFILFIPVVDG